MNDGEEDDRDNGASSSSSSSEQRGEERDGLSKTSSSSKTDATALCLTRTNDDTTSSLLLSSSFSSGDCIDNSRQRYSISSSSAGQTVRIRRSSSPCRHRDEQREEYDSDAASSKKKQVGGGFFGITPTKRTAVRERRLDARRLLVVLASVAATTIACLAAAAFFFVVASSVAQSRPQWNLTSRRILQKAIRKIERERSSSGQRRQQKSDDENTSTNTNFSILLRGSRPDLLLQSLDRHVRCRSVGQVQIDWTNKDGDGDIPRSLLEHRSGKVLEVDKTISADAVLLLDEGLGFSCNELERGYLEWRNDPARVVGLLPRHAGGPFVSDAAAFVHRLLLVKRPVYLNDKACQRLALSAQLSKLSSKESVSVLTKPVQFILDGEPAENEVRRCVGELKKVFRFEALSSEMKLYTGHNV